MAKLKDIEPIGVGLVNVQDVYRTLDGLSGDYRSRDLYERYCEAARDARRTPASINMFSRELTRIGLRRFVTRNMATWTVQPDVVLRAVAQELGVPK